MDQIAPSLMPSPQAEKTAQKYRGEIADGYEARRADKEKWRAEDRVLRVVLADLPAGAKVLDCPVGTGRFLPFYHEKASVVTGVDISADMLRHARTQHNDLIPWPSLVSFAEGSIFALPFPDRSFDVAVAVRIMNLIDADDMKKALVELQRVTRQRIVFNLRVWTKGTHYRRAQRIEDMRASIRSGWRIERDVEIHEPDFRMFVLCAG